MAASHEITCINKTDFPNPHERSGHVGGRAGAKDTGGAWKITQQETIQDIVPALGRSMSHKEDAEWMSSWLSADSETNI